MWQRIGKQVAAAGLAALVLAGCQSNPQAPTSAADPQQAWSQLQAQVGKYQHEALYLQNGVLAERLQHLLGAHTPEFLRNIEVAGPLQQEGSVYFITGNRPHEGGDNAGAWRGLVNQVQQHAQLDGCIAKSRRTVPAFLMQTQANQADRASMHCGFMMPCGSSAFLTACIMDKATGDW